MADKHDGTHPTNARELPEAKVDIMGIICRCYNNRETPDDALHECKRFGATEVTIAHVREAFEKLRDMERWMNELLSQLK